MRDHKVAIELLCKELIDNKIISTLKADGTLGKMLEEAMQLAN